MPCLVDPTTPQEEEKVRVCKLLVYVYGCMNIEVPEDIKQASKSTWATNVNGDKVTQLLCSCLKDMNENDIDKIVYNARNEDSRNLANWWENHQKLDKERLEKEALHNKNQILIKNGLSKLNDEEIRALGYCPEDY